jgi:hypothetical protein
VQTHSTTLQGAEGGSWFTFSQKEALRKANRSGAGSRPTDLDKAQSMKRFSNTSTIPLALTALLSLSTLSEAHANPLSVIFWFRDHVSQNGGMAENDPNNTHIITYGGSFDENDLVSKAKPTGTSGDGGAPDPSSTPGKPLPPNLMPKDQTPGYTPPGAQL